MKLTIPRGIIYHTLCQDLWSLASSLFVTLDNKPVINNFEQQFASYIGCQHGLSFPYARIAIYFTLKLKQFSPGSEIIMPPITIKAILDVVLDLGLKPVFVDIDPDTLGFDLNKLQKSITPYTKAILITYLYGMVPNMESMLTICNDYHLFIIEDFSQCLNGEYKNKKVGGFGHVGIYSASSIKTLDTYGGGLLVTDDTALYEQLRECQSTLEKPSRKFLIQKIFTSIVRNFATTRIIFHTLVFPLLKTINFFKPDTYIKNTGERAKTPLHSLPTEWFTSYTSFQAHIGQKLLSKVQEGDSQRIKNAEIIRANKSIHFPRGVDDTQNVYWQTIAYFSEPLEILKLLRDNHIDSATTSLEKISTLSNYPIQGNTPNADMIYACALFVPTYPGLKAKDLTHIMNTLNVIPAHFSATETLQWNK
ncbi:hypothetical protein TUM19329_13330 [Legionella antarctica]|uniref:Uncharacterized protein n=1 Tax=Legionella antarctica TaxID=2708020 RepID=A0A6F8T4M3_9GAMM|nr:DegT/DnrJ/EryC1/StrS aminotransferase family protein [Legionella antarctica]BCA94972.1 hypothetical protein TUM19329_13330 [Legionella antarctica]